MPRFSLDTNVPVSKISNEFLKDTLNVLKETLGKGTRVSTIFIDIPR